MKAKEYRKKITELINEENLLLPDFQRDFVWKPQEQQLNLVCSLFLDIPIGSILVLDKLDNIGKRQLCHKEKRSFPEGDTKLLMDGQQRISTIRSIFSDLYKNADGWEKIHKSLYNKLSYRWFLDLSLKDLKDNDLQKKLKLLYDFYWNKKFEDDFEEIKSFIINKKILSKNKDERWHPSKEIEKIKNYCEEENFLPLFLILSDFSDLTPIIKKISEKYIDFLIKEKKQNKLIQNHCNEIKKNFKVIIAEEKKSELTNKIETKIKQFFDKHIIYKEVYGVEYEKSQLSKATVAFKTMNTGGISLGVFDIVSAKYSNLNKGRLSKKLLEYAEKFIKKEEYEPSIADLIIEKFLQDDKNLITKSFSDMYLNILSLFIKEKKGEECKLDWIKQKSLLQIPMT